MVKLPRILLLAVAYLPGIGASGGLSPVDVSHPPWRGLLRVQTELGGRCTGFLIAPRLALTAAHCLFGQRSRHLLRSDSLHVLLRYAGGHYDAHARVQHFAVSPLYDPRLQARTAGLDRALLVLDHDVARPEDALRPTASPAVGSAVRLAGYGQDREELAVAGPACHITARSTDEDGRTLLVHDCAGTRGTSGAPLLWRDPAGAWRVVGVQIEARVGAVGGLAVPLVAPPDAATPSGSSSGR